MRPLDIMSSTDCECVTSGLSMLACNQKHRSKLFVFLFDLVQNIALFCLCKSIFTKLFTEHFLMPNCMGSVMLSLMRSQTWRLCVCVCVQVDVSVCGEFGLTNLYVGRTHCSPLEKSMPRCSCLLQFCGSVYGVWMRRLKFRRKYKAMKEKEIVLEWNICGRVAIISFFSSDYSSNIKIDSLKRLLFWRQIYYTLFWQVL